MLMAIAGKAWIVEEEPKINKIAAKQGKNLLYY
jgi:hypothetical protein